MIQYEREQSKTVGGFSPVRGEVVAMTIDVYMAVIATLTFIVAVITLLCNSGKAAIKKNRPTTSKS